MGLLDFVRDAGKNIFGRGSSEADAIKQEIQTALGASVSNLEVQFDDGSVTLTGQATSMAAKEKAGLIAGNLAGVSSVNDNGLTAPPPPLAAAAAAPAAPTRFYTIKSGDTLSKIAKEHYGDANAYTKIFEANREVIGDPDKIFPGQQIRIPA